MINFLYDLFVRTIAQISRCGIIFSPKIKAWHQGQKNLWEQLERVPKEDKEVVWVQCASLGEYEQAKSIIKALSREHSIYLTFFSPSGFRGRPKKWISHVGYMPLDSIKNAKKFLDTINPSLVVFTKYEYWNSLSYEIQKRQVPFILISAIFQKNQIFFKWYGKFFRKIISRFSHVYTQDTDSQKLLKGIGITNVSVSGDTRVDGVLDNLKNNEFNTDLIIKVFSGKDLIVVAGSTWPEDEKYIIPFINNNINSKCGYIIAPHEVSNKRIKSIERKVKLRSIRYSEIDHILEESFDVLVIDNIGLLKNVYEIADIAYIGGGFGRGIHNILEPACTGLPIIIGPNNERFIEAQTLIKTGGVIEVFDNQSIIDALSELMNKTDLYKKAKKSVTNYIRSSHGATELIIRDIFDKGYLNQG